jgi:hypothetical protein
MSISEDPRPVNVKLTGEVFLPSSSVVLPPRDDAAEYDDSGDTYNFQDDPKYAYKGVSKSFSTESVMKYVLTFGINH